MIPESVYAGDGIWVNPETGEIENAPEGIREPDLAMLLARKAVWAQAQAKIWTDIEQGVKRWFVAHQDVPVLVYGNIRVAVVRPNRYKLASEAMVEELRALPDKERALEIALDLLGAASSIAKERVHDLSAIVLMNKHERSLPVRPHARVTGIAEDVPRPD